MDYFSVLNVVEAWNEISWGDAIPFTFVLIGLYWVKVKIDTSLGSINKKQAKQLKRIIREAIDESELLSNDSLEYCLDGRNTCGLCVSCDILHTTMGSLLS